MNFEQQKGVGQFLRVVSLLGILGSLSTMNVQTTKSQQAVNKGLEHRKVHS